MIFVTVGTNEARFDRLLRAVAAVTFEEEVLVQHGHSSAIHPPGAELIGFLPFDEMVETVRRARLVVTHAGVGSIMIALANAKRPIVVPRLKTYEEAVDDHQLQLGRRFARAGLVTLVEAPDELGEAVRRPHEPPSLMAAASSALAADLGRFLEHAVATSAARPA